MTFEIQDVARVRRSINHSVIGCGQAPPSRKASPRSGQSASLATN